MPPRTLVSLLVLTMASIAVAAPAYADSASITFTDASGASDPVAGVGRTLTLSGNTATQEYVFVKWRAAGGAACAPSWSSDAGSEYFDNFEGDSFNDTSVNGNFSLVKTGTWDTPGTFMFCIWLAPNESAAVTPITQMITFRQPGGVISATVNPAAPRRGQSATVTITGSSEAPEYAYATIRPAGGASCAPSPDADSGANLLDDYYVDGAFSTQATVTESQPGTYLICLWLASSSDGTAIAGPQPETFTVPTPPPPACVTPTLAGVGLAKAQKQLRAAHCTVGAVSKIYSSTMPVGEVIASSPGPGRYPSGQSVALMVSAGPPPCIAPRLRGLTLAQAKATLRRAHCSLGVVRRPRHVRHRRVLHVRRQAVPAGSRRSEWYRVSLTLA